MNKFIILVSLLSILFVPSFGYAQTKFLSEEEQDTQEQVENIEEVQRGKPEGAGLVLGEKDLDLEKPTNIPGELGYSFKRFLENIVSAFTFKESSKVGYSMLLAERRLAELEVLLNRSKWSKTKSTIKLYKNHIQNTRTNFENLIREDRDRVDIQTNTDLLNFITVLSVFAENEDNSSVKSELNSALDKTVEFQKDIGL
ncbi:MAG: DUF5667 domain-containing protein [bacterium]